MPAKRSSAVRSTLIWRFYTTRSPTVTPARRSPSPQNRVEAVAFAAGGGPECLIESGGWPMELLERASFLDALAGYAAEARQGSGRLVLVSGESGIGKTALVEAFHAQLHGARWLWGACD